jgi:tetratricopeptide (TPR) repeat protein
MTISGPRLRTLLRQAERAKEAGKLAAAEKSYREILEEVPDSAEAWLGLAGLLKDPQAQEQAYEKVLSLDGENRDARIGLATLRGEPIPAREEEFEPEPEQELAAELKTAVSPTSASSAPLAKPPQTEDEEFELYCYRHPDRATALRCYSCNRPICSACTNKTPVGYICG